MILSASKIREAGILQNTVDRTVVNGMSAGYSSAGYDLRVADAVYLGRAGSSLDAPSARSSFQLAVSEEHFTMPNHVLGMVKDKSSWARQGVSVFNTVIEPDWEGYLTFEIVNHSRREIIIPAGSPIAQVIFMYIVDPDEGYSGKYQNAGKIPQPWIPEIAR